MALTKDPIFEEWWPLGQALTLVRAPIRQVAKAMKAEGKRAFHSEGIVYDYDWVCRNSIDDLFRSVEKFTYGSTMEYALPTKGGWTVIWNNSSLCTKENLAYRLTTFQKVETLSFYSTDRNSTQLAGTCFEHFSPTQKEEVIARNVYCCNQGSRWHFEQYGVPLPEEDIEQLAVKRKRDRLNEATLMALLERLGVHPWKEDTYDFGKKCFCMTHRKQYLACEAKNFEKVRARALGEAPPSAEDQELLEPPDYLRGYCGTPGPTSPAQLLKDGNWCGHGEKMFWVYDIVTDKKELFTVRLPEPDAVPVVEVSANSGDLTITIYDGRLHPANVFFDSKRPPVLQAPVTCLKCSSNVFRVAVGFEVPADAESANDTSWFSLALKCEACGSAQIAYQDETA